MNYEGLAQKEIELKQKQFGFNEIKKIKDVSPLHILFAQVRRNFLVYILALAAFLSWYVGKIINMYAIVVILFLIIMFGFVQEYKAEKAIKALKSLVKKNVVVIRESRKLVIDSVNLVPGDIVILESGDNVPADCILLENKNIRVDESILTGESIPIAKKSWSSGKLSKSNKLFMGTSVVDGKCIAKVADIGMKTEFGKIASLISKAEKTMPLQAKVNRMAKYMAYIAFISALLIGLVLFIRAADSSNGQFAEILVVMIALAISAFPEGFPVVLTLTLAKGISNMAKNNAIVNKMSSVETLGNVSVICTDKTGTITRDEMTVRKIYINNSIIDITGIGYSNKGDFLLKGKKIKLNDDLNLIIKAAVLCNNSYLYRDNKDYTIIGNPTEAALVALGEKAGILKEELERNYQRLDEIPFSSEKKIMSTLHRNGDEYVAYVKAAPEVIIKKSKYILNNGRIIKLTKKHKDKISSVNHELASNALRVIGVGYKKVNYSKNFNLKDDDIIFLGLISMSDPPRKGVKDAVKLCKQSSINVVMITGDHIETARAIGKEVGIVGNAITGDDLDKISDEELKLKINDFKIFARVRPEHKIRIIKAFKENNELVAMTGDGVNDAPALKQADVGIAMGKSGTDVSREASDIILKDDNFTTIVNAIKSGRTIFSNIRKFSTYQLSCNFAEITIILGGVLLGLPLPLLALQILFMNMVTDNLPALTLGFNPPSHDVMKFKPKKEREEILNKNLWIMLITLGCVMGIGTLIVYYLNLDDNITLARTTALITLIIFEVFNAFNFRSLRKSILDIDILKNKFLVAASIISIIATLAILYIDSLSMIFETVPVPLLQWFSAVLIGISVIVVAEILKKYFNIKKVNFY